MKDNNTLSLRIAQILRILEYSALTLILLSLGLYLFNIDKALIGAKAGIGLIVFAPVTGILATAVIFFLNRSYKYMTLSLFILLIFIIAVVVSI
ncbi:MAG: hypothetical protein JSU85_02665 [Candidatus Zixiibacteriota bacterium]|nr:MAG: hypothetical protein JSU85_02665 [candidate division Zixibacteria bacterium]